MNPALQRFPDHARIMGLIVLSYPDLIVSFAHSVGLAVGLKHAALEALLSLSGEKYRVIAGRALARRAIEERGLSAEMDEICRALGACGRIRNEYAHQSVFDEGGSLYLVEPRPDFDSGYKRSEVTLDLLRQQQAYFEYTRNCLLWLEGTLGGTPPLSGFPPKADKPLQPPRSG